MESVQTRNGIENAYVTMGNVSRMFTVSSVFVPMVECHPTACRYHLAKESIVEMLFVPHQVVRQDLMRFVNAKMEFRRFLTEIPSAVQKDAIAIMSMSTAKLTNVFANLATTEESVRTNGRIVAGTKLVCSIHLQIQYYAFATAILKMENAKFNMNVISATRTKYVLKIMEGIGAFAQILKNIVVSLSALYDAMLRVLV